MPEGYNFPAYASTHPAIAQLFANEFAQRQAVQQASQAQAAQETARAQIAAQSRLAEAQLRGQQQSQDQANLFRMQELKSREDAEAVRAKIAQQNADTEQKFRAGPAARSQVDIDEANASSEALAEQFNAAYQTRLKTATATIEAARKTALNDYKIIPFTASATKEINAKHDQLLKDSEDKITQEILDISIKNAPGVIGFDPLSKKFRSLKLGGGTPFKAPSGTAGGFDYMGNPVDPGAAAGLGARPAVVAPVVAPDAAANPAALGTTAQAVMAVGQPLAAAPVATQTIQVPIDKAHFMEMSAADAAEAERQLRAIPLEQRPAAAAAIRDNLMKSGRATIRVRIPPMHEILRDTNFN